VERAQGARLYDADGHEYVDYVMSWGAILAGHAHPAITSAVADAAAKGTSYGAPTAGEVELARQVTEAVPSVEMVRFVNSGTEATMSAVRLARAATGRELILKFAGCYHGHADSFLVQAGSGVATLGLPDSPGVPQALARLTLAPPFNDAEALAQAFAQHGPQIACVIIEPIIGNSGFIPPADGFLALVRELTTRHGALLLFDEVMTGFRVGLGGAQARYGITPDLTTMGKVIGGGLPVGAYGGRRELMEQVAPAGPVYQAGTLSGNPLAMAAGSAQLQLVRDARPHDQLERLATRLVAGVGACAAEHGLPFWGGAAGGMFGWHFVAGPVRDFATAATADTGFFARFYRGCLTRGVFLPPSPFEAAFLSLAHTEADIDFTLEQVRPALREALP
jgi:glutamate-1-semialdehyde 2,1-aminomutase